MSQSREVPKKEPETEPDEQPEKLTVKESQTKPQQEQEKIDGTYVFDGARSSKGYRLNKFFFSLNRAENRTAYKEDPEAWMECFGLSEWEKRKLREKDWLALAREGGANIYFMYKMGSVTGDSLQHIGAAFRGETLEEFLSTRKVQGAR